MVDQDIAVQVEEPRLDDGCSRVAVDFTEGVVLGHIGGDAVGVEFHTRGSGIAVDQTGRQVFCFGWIGVGL